MWTFVQRPRVETPWRIGAHHSGVGRCLQADLHKPQKNLTLRQRVVLSCADLLNVAVVLRMDGRDRRLRPGAPLKEPVVSYNR